MTPYQRRFWIGLRLFRISGLAILLGAASLPAAAAPEGSPPYQNVSLKWNGPTTPYWTTGRILAGSGVLLLMVIGGMAAWRYRSLFRINRDLIHQIAERKRAEEKVRESEERLSAILDNVGAHIFIKDLQYRYTYANRMTCGLFGRTFEEIEGKTDAAFFDPASVEEILRSDRPVLEEGKTISREEADLNASGVRNRTYWTVKLPLRDGEGKIAGLCGISTDITERKRAESNLAHMHELMQYVISHAQSAIAVHDRDMRYIYVSEQYLKQYNVKEQEVIGKHHYEVFPDLPQKWREVHKRVLAGAVEGKDEDPYEREDGSVDWTRWECRPWYESDGAIGGLIVYTEVITERKRREDALRASEHQLADSQRIAHIGSWEHNPKTGEISWSDELFRLLGLDPATDRADFGTFFRRIHPDDQPLLKAAVETSLREKKPFDLEYRFVIPGRPVRFIHARADLVPDPSGELSLLRGTAQDITERKRAEERVRRSEQFIRGILDTVDEGFIVIDRDYRIVTANKAYGNQTSHPCDEVIGKHCYEISHKSNRPCFELGEECAVREVFATGEPHAALHKHSGNGQILYVETKAYPIKDETGRITSVIETINNITEKHLLEEERLKTQKLESIGILAGGIAHDFNNLLQGVFGYISLAKMVFDQKEKSFAMLEQAEQALHQSVSLTTQLLTFSRGGASRSNSGSTSRRSSRTRRSSH